AVPIATGANWRLSVGLWAGPVALAALAWLALALKLPAAHRAPASAAPTSVLEASPRIARSGLVWGLVVLFAMIGVSNYGIITWVPAVLTDAGGSAALGGTMVALYSAWGVVAAFVLPQVATRLANPFIAVAVCSVFLVGGYL